MHDPYNPEGESELYSDASSQVVSYLWRRVPKLIGQEVLNIHREGDSKRKLWYERNVWEVEITKVLGQ